MRKHPPIRRLFQEILHEDTPESRETRTHVEVEERVHLVLNDGNGLEQLLCVHGPHHTIHSVWRRREMMNRED